MSRNKKGELIFIVVLLSVCSIGLILGVVGKSLGLGKPSKEENPENNASPNLTVDLIDGDNFYGTYTCQEGAVYCGLAYETVDDSNYQLNYYDDGEINELPYVAGTYVFLVDALTNEEYYRESPIILYNMVLGTEVARYEAVKNYTVGIEDGLFIVKKDGKWGILSLTAEKAELLIEPSYDFIGLINNINQANGMIVNDKFVASRDGNWSIIDRSGAVLYGSLSNEIVDYNEQYFIALNGSGKQVLYNYQGARVLNDSVFNKIIFVGRYIGVYDNSNQFYILNQLTNTPISNRHNYTNYEDVEIEIQNGRATIKVKGYVEESNIII